MIVSFSHEEMSSDVLHKIVCANFQERSEVKAALIKGSNAVVLCNSRPSGEHELLSKELSEFDKGDTLEVLSHIAFCNRGNRGLHEKKLKHWEVLAKFCSDAGLECVNGDASFLGPVSTSKFNIHNAFSVSGVFQVTDAMKFNQKIQSGIGSRRGYGFGLILAKKLRR